MISFIKGTIVDIEADKIVMECNDIGYNIFVPANFISEIGQTGKVIKVFTYLSVREDAMVLYGFRTKEELNIFKKMITVSGIGPKGALGILSVLSVDNLKIAILSDDAKAISKAPGIGVKTASKLILELKDKFDINEVFEHEQVDQVMNSESFDNQKDAVDALTALGYSPSQSLTAIKKIAITENTSVSDIIKMALKVIG